jgi:hypothetical protein
MSINHHDQNISSILQGHIKEENIGENVIIRILRNIKKTLMSIIDDIKNSNYNSFSEFLGLFVKDNRILYFGIFLLLIAGILYVISLLFYSPKMITPNVKNNIAFDLSNPNNINLKDIYNKIENLGEKIKLNNLTMELLNKTN